MTEPSPYEVTVDQGTGMLRATLSGFWDLPTAISYGERLEEAAGQLSDLTARPRWLIDLSGMEVQSGEITEHMKGVLTRLIAKYRPIVALARSRALVAVQSRRIANRPDHRFFASLEEAQACLADQHEAAAAAATRID